MPELEHPDLLAVAAEHHAAGLHGSGGGHDHACACWVICTGWPARVGGSGRRVDMPCAGWRLRPARRVAPARTMYGHDALQTGALTLDDGALLRRALRLAR